MSKNFTSTIAGATIFISLTGIITKGLGFLREMLFANFFGLGADFDIYLVGAVLPLTINVIIFYLAQNYIIPTYNNLKEKNPLLIDSFIQINLFAFLFWGIIISILLYFSSDLIIALYLKGANQEIMDSANIIFKLFLITIPINCTISVLSTYQHLNFEFKYPAYSHLVLNFSFVVLIIIFIKNLEIYVIPAGYITGLFLQMFYLFKKAKIKFNLSFTAILFKEFKKFIPETFLIIILIESIGQLYLITDRYFYNDVPAGGIAALNYAQTIYHLPISILSVALSTAIFPRFSQYISKNLTGALEGIFNESIRISIAIFIPVVILFLYYGNFIIKILFERGKFSAANTQITYEVLIFLSISLVFYAVYSVVNKLLFGMRLIKSLLYITIAGILIKITLNFLLVGELEQNGLALSTSLSYLFFFVASLLLVYKRVPFHNKNIFFIELFFYLSNGFLSLLLVKQLSGLFDVRILFFEIVVFLLLFMFNVILIKHSSVQLFKKIFVSLKPGKNSI
jgi:putative peptidoglycan lipid II flippase